MDIEARLQQAEVERARLVVENEWLREENARLTDEIRVLVETSDQPCRQMRLTARMDRVEWVDGDWALHYCHFKSIHQGKFVLWRGDKCMAVGSREWCEQQRQRTALAEAGDAPPAVWVQSA